jgi:sialate O-acetylesterase
MSVNLMKIRILNLILCSCSFMPAAFGKVTLPSLFCDHMVLQRESEVAVWGRSDKTALSITGSWNGMVKKVTVNADGSWKARIKTPAAGGPYALTLDDGEVTVLNDVLIGEVWICSGQSNMDMPVRGLSARDTVLNKQHILATAQNSQIRLFKLPHKASAVPEKDSPGRWQLSDSVTANTFSAVGYQYAQILQEKLSVPVGMIHSAWSGTRIEPWMSPESLAAFNYVRPATDTAKVSRTSSSALFNGMISPLIGFTCKGILWYQGESNLTQHAVYDQMMAAMVSGWKKGWGQDRLAFYYVQIAPFNYGKAKSAPYLREAQQRAMKLIPDSYMVGTVDIGSEKTIHPADKGTVSQRLAYAALTRAYGLKDFPYEHASFESVKFKRGKGTVRIAHAMKGLVAAENPAGFEVAGDDQVFYPATTSIRKNKIVVQNEQVSHIRAVRYCFSGYAPGMVHNGDGLPLLPFRTDTWPINKAQ